MRPEEVYLLDSMIADGLTDPYTMKLMGDFADLCAGTYSLSREDQELYAEESITRATDAYAFGAFKSQIIPELALPSGSVPLDRDEGLAPVDRVKLRRLPVVFGHTITAGVSSQIADGAAAVLLATKEGMKILDRKPLARIIGFSHAMHDSKWFTTAPILAIQKLLHEHRLLVSDIDLFEINEAFAVVPMVAIKELNIPRHIVNVWGGAIALGHPLAASGPRILMNLVCALKERKLRRGIAAICHAGGGAIAVLIETV